MTVLLPLANCRGDVWFLVRFEGAMRPKKHKTTGSDDLFPPGRTRSIFNMKHDLVQLAGKIDWELNRWEITPPQRERPAWHQDRLHDRLLLLKQIDGCPMRGLWALGPFQYFTGEAN